jgi:hypothetical protein
MAKNNDGQHIEESINGDDDTRESDIQRVYSDLRESVVHPGAGNESQIASSFRRLSLVMTANRVQPAILPGVILISMQKILNYFFKYFQSENDTLIGDLLKLLGNKVDDIA